MKFLHQVYSNMIIDGKKYSLYCALFRTEKEFIGLIPYYENESDNIKILLDHKSDVCLVYGDKKILTIMKEQEKLLDAKGVENGKNNTKN